MILSGEDDKLPSIEDRDDNAKGVPSWLSLSEDISNKIKDSLSEKVLPSELDHRCGA